MVLVGMVTIIFPDQLGIAANSNPVSLRKETIKPEGVDILAKPRTIQGNELVIMLKGMMDNMSHVFYLVQNLNGKAKVECRPKNNSFIPLPKTVVERFLETIGKKTLSPTRLGQSYPERAHQGQLGHRPGSRRRTGQYQYGRVAGNGLGSLARDLENTVRFLGVSTRIDGAHRQEAMRPSFFYLKSG